MTDQAPPDIDAGGSTLPSSDRRAGLPTAPMSPGASGERPDDRIGHYRLLEVIGEGGFGTVWLAERREPMLQRVAIKVIKPGMDSKAVVARFEQERQALAFMDHPNVARVLDGGVTPGGRPYFVMEHVKGEPITAYCDRARLTMRQRLELFIPVCDAVQHAHMKGIIHRDLKPSNILVAPGEPGTVPIVKIIDFGVAKAMSRTLTDKTIFTEQGQIIGTPEYMSPEQAEMGATDIDTRTDVYSLGVVLYELLSGTLPLDSATLRTAGFAEVQRIIREHEPLRPSARLSIIDDTIGVRIARARQTDRESIAGELRRELEWIPLKALRKDRTRRYASAEALGADIRRYLSGRPLEAAPESRAYLLRKFVRRNRVQVAAAGAIVLVLGVGMAAAGLALNRALIAEQQLRRQLTETEKVRQAEKERADQLKKVADFQSQMLGQIDTTNAGVNLLADVRSRFAAALEEAGVPSTERASQVDTLNNLLVRVNATDIAAAMIDRTLLKPAVAAIDKQFKDQPLVDAQLRQALADYYSTLGLYDAAQPLQESAMVTRRRLLGSEHPDTLTSVHHMGHLLQLQGRLEEAATYYKEALDARRRVLGAEHPDTLTSINSVGLLMHLDGQFSLASTHYREALDARRRVLGAEHPDTLTSISNMGLLLASQGNLAEAEPYYREALEASRRVLGAEHPETLISINNMSVLLRELGRLAEAEPYAREALEAARRVLGDRHPDTLTPIHNMAFLLHMQGRLSEAEAYYREAKEGFRRVLGEHHPYSLIATVNLGGLLRDGGRYQEAIGLLSPAEPACRKTFTHGNIRRLAACLVTLGIARTSLGYQQDRFRTAESNLLEAYSMFVSAPDRGPAHKETLECVQGLVDLYTAWESAEPGNGNDLKAAEWRGKLAEEP